jgi:hydroxyethylthiazole kinase-like uncharacterized protein yjeF
MTGFSPRWPRSIYSTEQVRGFDRRAIEELGIEGFELMQRAGAAALDCVRDRWPEAESLLIYCGAGNNAGDGYVLAALAVRAGLSARVVTIADPSGLSGDAARACAMAREAAVEFLSADSGAAIVGRSRANPAAGEDRPAADLLVDALLGTGLTRDLEGPFAAAVGEINRSGVPVLALDIPTGLDGDTGRIHGVAVEADATITFVGLKSGLYLGQGPHYRGELAFADLGLPAAVFAGADGMLHRLDPADTAQLLKPRSRMSHKGLNGKVLIVGGGVGMSGAARLAAEAALRSGAGLVHAAVHPSSVTSVMAGRPEIMCRGVERIEDCADWLASADAVVLGPGLGQSQWSRQLAAAVLGSDRTLVVDADGLNYLAQHPRRRDRWVITPHPGEAARLLNETSAELQAARDRSVARLAEQFGAAAVLKGADSLIASARADGKIAISVCDYGNPGMASGGMGDVLSGVVGALIAQFGFSALAVEVAVLVHALAGDDAAEDGQRGLLASDLLPHIRRRVNPA